MLEEGALQLYINEIEGNYENWGSVVQLFHNSYYSASHKGRMSYRLQEIRISDFEKFEQKETDALRKVAREIDRLSPMSYPECQTDHNKKVFLQGAIKVRDWALFVLSNSYGLDMTYKDMGDKL